MMEKYWGTWKMSFINKSVLCQDWNFIHVQCDVRSHFHDKTCYDLISDCNNCVEIRTPVVKPTVDVTYKGVTTCDNLRVSLTIENSPIIIMQSFSYLCVNAWNHK